MKQISKKLLISAGVLLFAVVMLGINLTGVKKEAMGASDILEAKIDDSKTYQEIDGFGAGFPVAWGGNQLNNHSCKQDIYKLLFGDAALSIVRFMNRYEYTTDNPADFGKVDASLFNAANKFALSRGEKTSVLMSSWSPKGSLKTNEREKNTSDTQDATLSKDANGNYEYAKFGQYWKSLIGAYKNAGVPIDVLSIQNEGDFEVSYEGCSFGATETKSKASYARAYLAVYNEIKNLTNPPKMIGPETMTTSESTINAYMKDVMDTQPDSVYGIAHHLYAGAECNYMKGTVNPDSYIINMKTIAANFPNKKKWQTEFFLGDAFDTAKMIQNFLIYENGNAYLFWDGVWGEAGSGLISMQNPEPGDWTTDKGFTVNPKYYALRHFSQYIRPGDIRVDVGKVSNPKLTLSAYESKDKHRMTVVGVNASDSEIAVHIDNNFAIKESAVYVSECKNGYTNSNLYNYGGTLDEGRIVRIPAKGIVTIAMFDQPGLATITTKKDEPGVSPYTSINLKKTKVTIPEKEFYSIKLSVFPKLCADSLIFESTNKKIARVSFDGIVEALSPGTASITVKSKLNSKLYKKLTLYVSPSGVKNFKITSQNGKVISMSWKKVSRASGYILYSSTKKKGEFKKLKTFSSPQSTKTKIKAKKGKTYFKIVAYKSSKGKKILSKRSKIVHSK